jgi:glycosyltransferase involved in cell wall biosynthesis
MSQTLALVVPCYNEAARFDPAEFLRLSRLRSDLALLFVDDGSSDSTADVLERLRASNPSHIQVHRLERNCGKAEAVRRGLVEALARGAVVVGYADADLSTPVDEILRLVTHLQERPAVEVVLGARVRLLGTEIERLPHRHFLGRIFATVASIALRVPVYDTQCGAKVFRASPALAAALAVPFQSRWIFDVELLARLLRGTADAAPVPVQALNEVPLAVWRDVGGSKLRASSMLHAGLQLLWLLATDRLGLAQRVPPPAPRAMSANARGEGESRGASAPP